MDRQIKYRAAWPLLIFCCIVFVLAACGGNMTAGSTTDTSAELQIALLPAAGDIDGETIGIQLTNASGAPVTDATVAVEGNMNHAGMAPVIAAAVTDDADGTNDGIYHLPFRFSMLGDWIITVTVTQADGTTVTRDIEATVGEDGITSAAPQMDANMGTMDHSAMMAEQMGQLMISDLLVRPAPLAGGNGAVYLTIHNHATTADQLVSGTTVIAAAAEFHETINDNNVMRMEARPEGFPIPAGGVLVLEPGDKHLMLVDLAQPLAEGDTFTLTLTFTHAEPVTLDVTVGAMTDNMAQMDHGHAMPDMAADATPTKSN